MKVVTPIGATQMASDGDWVDIEVAVDMEPEYRRLTGWDGADRPTGLWIVLARLAFTREGPLPPGGVLLSIHCDAAPPPRGMTVAQCLVEVVTRATGSGKQILVVRCALRDRAAPERVCARVSFELLWPGPSGQAST